MSFAEKIRRRLLRERRDWQPVEFEANGFCVGSERVAWREISGISAFKRDLLTIDEVYLQFSVGEKTVQVCEEQPGFTELEAELIQRYPSTTNWRKQVMLPPFSENFTILYRAP